MKSTVTVVPRIVMVAFSALILTTSCGDGDGSDEPSESAGAASQAVQRPARNTYLTDSIPNEVLAAVDGYLNAVSVIDPRIMSEGNIGVVKSEFTTTRADWLRHDRQRFFVYKNAMEFEYSALATLYYLPVGDIGDQPVLVAVVHVDPDPPPSAPAPKGFDFGQTCVYVEQDGNKYLGYFEKIQPPNPCPATPTGSSVPVHYDQYSDQEVPKVVRWGWDPTRRRPVVGVRCDYNWCQFPLKGQILNDPGQSPPIEWVVPGWHDEQYLAGKNGRTSSLVGAIYPSRTMKNRPTRAHFLDGRDYHQATIVINGFEGDPDLSDNLAAYAKKWNLQTIALGDIIEVYVELVQGSDTEALQFMKRYQNGNPNPVETGTPKRIRRHPSAALHAFATRWQWLDTDEDIWYRCGDGCCESGTPH